MFAFLRRSGVHRPSPAIQRALAARELPPGMDPSTLRVVESRGTYAGRGVTYLLVFDLLRARELGVAVDTARDLEARADLVIAIGHVEQDGSVVLNTPVASGSVPAPLREQADRAAHGEDDAVVFPRAQLNAGAQPTPPASAPVAEGRGQS